MSNELKQTAEQALKELGEARKIVRASSSRQLAKDWDRRATDALANLRTAIQQAEAQQPVTGDPVAWMHPSGGVLQALLTGLERRTYTIPLYTHPAPSVPDDVVRDAERYEWLREQNESLESFTFYVGCDNVPDDDGSVAWVGADLDAAIDAAMLAAK